jgi:hypothetical protein
MHKNYALNKFFTKLEHSTQIRTRVEEECRQKKVGLEFCSAHQVSVVMALVYYKPSTAPSSGSILEVLPSVNSHENKTV